MSHFGGSSQKAVGGGVGGGCNPGFAHFGGLCAVGGGWGVGGGALGGQDEGAYASSEAQGPLCETLPHHALIRSAGLIGLG